MVPVFYPSLPGILCVLRALCVKSFSFAAYGAALLLFAMLVANVASTPQEAGAHAYLGFDRNDYPGNAAMKRFRRDFAFTGFWLSPPPGEKTNSWTGKHDLLRAQGFGFVVLYRGRESSELKKEAEAKRKGARDAEGAIAAAKREKFTQGTIIFLDIEEGGRLPETYHAYLAAWSVTLTHGGFRPGVYCSGIPVNEEPGVSIITTDDIRNHPATRDMAVWVYNDACPPSPGCFMPKDPPAPSKSGITYAQVWQFVRSPRDKETAVRCRGYAKDGNCYAALDTAHRFHLDLNSAASPDPSGGAR